MSKKRKPRRRRARRKVTRTVVRTMRVTSNSRRRRVRRRKARKPTRRRARTRTPRKAARRTSVRPIRWTVVFKRGALARELIGRVFRGRRRRLFLKSLRRHRTGGVFVDHPQWQWSASNAQRMRTGILVHLARGRRRFNFDHVRLAAVR